MVKYATENKKVVPCSIIRCESVKPVTVQEKSIDKLNVCSKNKLINNGISAFSSDEAGVTISKAAALYRESQRNKNDMIISKRFFDQQTLSLGNNPSFGQIHQGIGRPANFYGFVNDTYIEIIKRRDGQGTRARLRFPTSATTYWWLTDITFEPINDYEERAMVYFYKDNKVIFHPHNFYPDLFDSILLDAKEEGRTMQLRRVKIILNKCMIMIREFDDLTVDHLWLDPYIYHTRISNLGGVDNQIVRAAVLDFGKSWSPKYGQDWGPAGSLFPGYWCSDFAAWAIRHGGGHAPLPPADGSGLASRHMANYHIPRQSFFTPKICYKDDNPDNPPSIPILWDQFHLITPGYYVKMNLGGHAELFLAWITINDSEASFLTIGGSVGSRVTTCFRRISRDDEDADIHWGYPEDPSNANQPKKDYHHYYDGFMSPY